MSHIYDVAVIGAGPGGASAAYYLARKGLDVLLLDRAIFPRDKTCGDALMVGGLIALREMGLLDQLRSISHPIQNFELVGRDGYTLQSALPVQPEVPGSLVIPRRILDHMLVEQAIVAGATFQNQFRATDIQVDSTGAVISSGQESVRCHAVIVATGVNASLLQKIGILRHLPPMMLAVRGYFEGIAGLHESLEFHFAEIPLPGYGWIFPLSEDTANIGLGLCSVGMAALWLKAKATSVFERFIQTPLLRDRLHHAQHNGTVRGYPLRCDFATAPTFGNRILLVGESAGLVNPLTGEGITYALESGKIAAEHLAAIFGSGDFSPERFAEYDKLLRQRYQKRFVFCNWVRDLLVNRLLIDRLIHQADQHPALKRQLIKAVLE